MDLFVKFIADGLIVVIAAWAIGAILWQTPSAERYQRYTRLLMAGLTSYLLAKIVSVWWQPEQFRPFELQGVDPGSLYLDNPGFPSDHMLLAVFLVLAVWYATRNTKTTLILAVLAIVMGIGRILALVHTPLDIVGGVVFAVVGAVWYLDRPSRRRNDQKVIQ